MPIYEFECPKHGRFEVTFTGLVALKGPPKRASCTKVVDRKGDLCNKRAGRVLSVPGGVIVEGGTGARRSSR